MADFDLDLIYETALVPQLWPDLIQKVAGTVRGMGGILFTSNPVDTRFVATPSCQKIMEEFIEGGWMHRNTRMQRLSQSNIHGFVTEADFFTEANLASDPLYTEFFWPRGVGWGTGTLIRVPTGDLLMFHLERWREDGCFGPEVVTHLDQLRPHLARAALLSVRLSDERARGAVTSLEAVGMPAAVISANGRVLASNALLEGTAAIRSAAFDRIRLSAPASDAKLAEAVEALFLDRVSASRSIPIAATDTEPASVLHVVPLKRRSREIFDRADAIVVLTPLHPDGPAPNPELLGGLFDLTPAEARVAGGIASGKTVQEIAAISAISPETVRSHLKSVLAKTGVNRQADLVILLSGSALRPGP